MLNSRHIAILKLAPAVLLSCLLLTGCVDGRFNPDGWAGPTTVDNTLIVCSSGDNSVIALDLSDEGQEVLWKFAPESDLVGGGFGCAAPSRAELIVYASPVSSDGMVYVASYEGDVYAIDSSNAADEYAILRLYEGKKTKPDLDDIYVMDGDRELGDLEDFGVITKDQRKQIEDRAVGVEGTLETNTGWVDDVIEKGIISEDQGEDIKHLINDRGVQWVYEADDRIVGNPAVIDGTLAVAAGNELFTLDTENGTQWWTEPFKSSGEIWSNLRVFEGRVYFGTLGHKFYAVDLQSGEEVWKRDFDGAIASTPLIVDNTVYIGTFEGKLYALDAETGNDKWTKPFQAGDWFWSAPAYKDGTIYAGSLDHYVYAVDAATGDLKWSYETSDKVKAAPVIAGDVLVVASKANGGPVYGLDLENGTEKWKMDRGKIYADPYYDGTAVYLLNTDDTLFALNAETGDLLWPSRSLD